jgi:hypothetical protein
MKSGETVTEKSVAFATFLVATDTKNTLANDQNHLQPNPASE